LYEYTETRPILRGRGDGRVMVAGGARRPMPDDISPAPTVRGTNQAPASTNAPPNP
jgi:hypothetical protein